MTSPAPAVSGADEIPDATSPVPLTTSAPPKIAFNPLITENPKIHVLSVVTKNH